MIKSIYITYKGCASLNFQRSQLMQQFPKAIFGDLKAAANRAKAQGQTLIDLSLGSPDLPPHPLVRETLSTAAALPNSYGYTLGGIDAFHEAVARYYKRRVDVTLDPASEVLQTIGSQEGLVHLPLAFCNPGDIVLTTDPGYVAYEAGIRLAKAEAYYMPLTAEHHYLPDLNAIPPHIAQRATLLILNLPGNPVPAMPSLQYFNEVVAFAKKYNIIVLHDAAYSEFYFEGDAPMSFLQAEGAKDVGMETNSLSKSFSLAGARIAYLVGNADMLDVLRALKSNLDYGIFEPIQQAAVTALDHAEMITDTLRQTFKVRHTLLREGLTNLGWDVAPSSGGMFLYAKYPLQQFDDVAFAYHLIEQTGIVVVPGSAFGKNGAQHVRIALVQPESVLQEALERLQTLV